MRVRLYAVVVPILLCITSCGALADNAADRTPAPPSSASPSPTILSLSKESFSKDAKAAIAAKDWDKANSLIEAISANYPDDASTLRILKGAVLAGQGKPAEALDEINAGLLAAKTPTDTAWVAKALDSIQSAYPKPSAETLEKLGDCYRMANSFAKAVKCYETAIYKRDISADTGKRIRRWLIKCHIRNREWAKVEKEIDDIAAESPECAAWSYYSLGCYYQRFRKYPQAIECFAKAVPADKKLPAPDAKSVNVALVDCYTGAKKWDAATELLGKLAAQYPKEAAHWHECAGAIYQGRKKYPEAIAELRQAIAPKGAVTARKRLGDCYKASLPPAQAAPLIEELVNKHPDDGPYLSTIAGRMYQGMRQYDKAVALLKLVVERFPNARWQVWDALVYIAECMYPQGRGEEAVAYLNDFYAKHPDRPMDYAIAYGRVLMDVAGMPAEAAEVLAKAVAEHPKDPLVGEIRNRLVAAYIQSKQTDRAVEVLRAVAADAKPEDRPALTLSEADIYFDARRYREAAESYREVMNAPGASPDARAQATYQLALCYEKSGLTRSAGAYMQRVSEKYPTTEWARKARGMLYVWDNFEHKERLH